MFEDWLTFDFKNVSADVWFNIIVMSVVLALVLLAFNRYRGARIKDRIAVEQETVVADFDKLSRWPQFKYLRGKVVSELKYINPQGKVADLGCGSGYLIIDMAKAFPELRLIAFDSSKPMLERARQNILRSGIRHENVHFQIGNVEKLPFEDDSLDVIVSTLSLHHWDNPRMAFDEIYRVLKKGGNFVILDVRRDVWLIIYLFLRFIQMVILPKNLYQINEPFSSFKAAYICDEVRAILSNTSFIDWQIKTSPFWFVIVGRK